MTSYFFLMNYDLKGLPFGVFEIRARARIRTFFNRRDRKEDAVGAKGFLPCPTL